MPYEPNDLYLQPVKERLEPSIKAFLRDLIRAGTLQFRIADLRHYIVTRAPLFAPGSPCRVLREMRAKGILDYLVLSRKDSLYELTRLEEWSAKPPPSQVP